MMDMDLRGADAALFDFDGCLVDSRVAFTSSLNAAFERYGLPPRPDEELHGFLGPPLYGTLTTLLAEHGHGEEMAESLLLSYRARLRELGDAGTTVFAGVAAAVERLAARMPLVVATSKARALAEPLLVSLGLRPFFAEVYGPSLEARAETKGETIARALQGLPGARAPVMIGDRHYDVAGAREHGLPCIGVLWGIGSEEELRGAGAVALAREPAELVTLLGA
jgi:phosphoglycolate phosphatase